MKGSDAALLVLMTLPAVVVQACGGAEPSQDPYDPLGKWHGRHMNCGHPAYMYRLPKDAQDKIRDIWAKYEAGDECEKESELTMRVVQAIPMEERMKIFRGMCGPAFLKDATPSVRTQFQNIWFDDNLTVDEKEAQFKKLAFSLLQGDALTKFNDFAAELQARKLARQQSINGLSPAARAAYEKWNEMRRQERLYLGSLTNDVRAELRLVCTFCGTQKVGKQPEHRRQRRSVHADVAATVRALHQAENDVLGNFY